MLRTIIALLFFFICNRTCAQVFHEYLKNEIQHLHTNHVDTVVTLTRTFFSRHPDFKNYKTSWLFWKKDGQLFSRKYVLNETEESKRVSRSQTIHCKKQDAVNWLIKNDTVIRYGSVFPYIIQYTENGITSYDVIHIPDTSRWTIAIQINNEEEISHIDMGYLIQKRDAQTPENINYSYNLNSPVYKALSVLRIYAAEYNGQYVFKPWGSKRLKRTHDY